MHVHTVINASFIFNTVSQVFKKKSDQGRFLAGYFLFTLLFNLGVGQTLDLSQNRPSVNMPYNLEKKNMSALQIHIQIPPTSYVGLIYRVPL